MNRIAPFILCAAFTTARGEAAAEPGGSSPAAAASEDRWAPFRDFLGVWEGTSEGQPGKGTLRREYRLVLNDRFIEVRNRSVYPPQEKNAKGEVHEDAGYLSLDRRRKVYVLRQFHVEGFVNTYSWPASSAGTWPIVFTTEAIENIPSGWRARESYHFESRDVLVERFELAGPGEDFTLYSEAKLRRVAGP